MASFSIRNLDTDEKILKAFSSITMDDVYKDYHKDCFRVYHNENQCLSLKFPRLKIMSEPKTGDKFIYANIDSTCKKDRNLVDIFDSLDNYLSSKMPDKYVSKVQPTFKNINSGLVKLYIPYKGGVINTKRLKIFDAEKNMVEDISCIKENSPVRVLAYLKQYKRYQDEIIPMWVLEQIQLESEKPKEPKEPKEPEEPEENSEETKDGVDQENNVQEEISEDLKPIIEKNHKELDIRQELLVDAESEDDDIHDNDYETPW